METGSETLEMFMKTVTDRLNRQEELIQILVDDLKERNKDGKLFIRGERMYGTRLKRSSASPRRCWRKLELRTTC